jgi:cellulose synthase/poly-beta-1,6-N-acetylglucosamine synthase-like glycosyltransferase
MAPSTTEWLFWASAGFVAYTYVGYPLLLAVRARWRPAPPVLKGDAKPPVSVVVVAHDEERHIEGKIRDCLEQDYPADRLEVVVASDGSRDRTEEIVASYASRGVRLVALPGPRGKPAALNGVVPLVRGEILVLADARQRLDPRAVSSLVANLADPAVGAVSGELHIQGPAGSVTGGGVGAYWRVEKAIRQLEARVDSTVGVTGALYALRRALFRPLAEKLILDDVAVPMAVVGAGFRVVFEPAAQAFDMASETVEGEFRRKVRTLAGNLQLVRLQPWLLSPRRNRLWWQFHSHKLARLGVPWALVILFMASVHLAASTLVPSQLYLAAALGQGVFYLAGAGGWLLEIGGKKPGLLSGAAAFLLLNLAAAAAPFQLLLGRSRVTWRGDAGGP